MLLTISITISYPDSATIYMFNFLLLYLTSQVYMDPDIWQLYFKLVACYWVLSISNYMWHYSPMLKSQDLNFPSTKLHN